MLNRGGDTNLNGAPVISFAPAFSHKLNDPDSERTLIDSMKVALNNPAFEAKWGDLLRAKHPALKLAADNASKSRANTAHAQDGNFVLKDEPAPNNIPGRANAQSNSERGKTDAEKDTDQRLAEARALIASGYGKATAWNGTEAELNIAKKIKEARETLKESKDEDAIKAAKALLARLDTAMASARNAARREAADQIEAAYAMKAAVGDSSEVQTYFDPALRVYRPV